MWCRFQSHHWTPRSLSRPYRAESTPARPSPAPAWGSGSAWWSDRWAGWAYKMAISCSFFIRCRYVSFWFQVCALGWRNRCRGRSKRTCPWTYWSAHTSWQTLCQRSWFGNNRYCGSPSCGPRRKPHSRTYRFSGSTQCCPCFLSTP